MFTKLSTILIVLFDCGPKQKTSAHLDKIQLFPSVQLPSAYRAHEAMDVKYFVDGFPDQIFRAHSDVTTGAFRPESPKVHQNRINILNDYCATTRGLDISESPEKIGPAKYFAFPPITLLAE